ncbi:hypothetical protein ABUE29_04685 [Mesorhizobium sp. ZMM04-4]
MTLAAGRWRAVLAAATAACVGGGAPAPVVACGYENPETVALGSLNWAYPDALHVRTAVWQAEDVGILPPRVQPSPAGPLAFYRAAATMTRFGARLADARAPGTELAISVVLIPQVMWTRYQIGPEGTHTTTHADGPAAGDLVVVTGEKVMRAILDGRLNGAEAERLGLLRLYDRDGQSAAARAVMMRAGSQDRVAAGASGTTDF